MLKSRNQGKPDWFSGCRITSCFVWEKDKCSRAFSWRSYFQSGTATATGLDFPVWSGSLYCYQKWKHFFKPCFSLGLLLFLRAFLSAIQVCKKSREKKAISVFLDLYYLERDTLGYPNMATFIPIWEKLYPAILWGVLSCVPKKQWRVVKWMYALDENYKEGWYIYCLIFMLVFFF